MSVKAAAEKMTDKALLAAITGRGMPREMPLIAEAEKRGLTIVHK